MSNFYRFVSSIFKYFFKGIFAIIYFVFDVVKHLFYGIWVIFRPLFSMHKKPQKEELDDIKSKIMAEQLEKAKRRTKE